MNLPKALAELDGILAELDALIQRHEAWRDSLDWDQLPAEVDAHYGNMRRWLDDAEMAGKLTFEELAALVRYVGGSPPELGDDDA